MRRFKRSAYPTIRRNLQTLDQLLRIYPPYVGQRLPQVDHRDSPRYRPASKTQGPPLRLRKNQLFHQRRLLHPQQAEDPGAEKCRGSCTDGRHGAAPQAYQPIHRQGHACHEKNVQLQLTAYKTLYIRSRRPKVYRQSDSTGVSRKEEVLSYSACLKPRDPFFFFLPPVIFAADPTKISAVTATKYLPAPSKIDPVLIRSKSCYDANPRDAVGG